MNANLNQSKDASRPSVTKLHYEISRRRRKISFGGLCLVVLPLMTAGILLTANWRITAFMLAHVERWINHFGLTNSLMAVFPMYVGMLVGIHCMVSTDKKLNEDVYALTASEDTGVVGILAENFLGSSSWSVYTEKQKERGKRALLRLLPQVQSDDAFQLTVRQRACLHKALTKDDVPMILAVLQALEKIGDRQAIFYVGRLLTGNYPASSHAEVRESANRCLPLLYERARWEKPSQVLLRPSAKQEPTADVLLRAAASAGEADPTQLIRAAQEPEQVNTLG